MRSVKMLIVIMCVAGAVVLGHRLEILGDPNLTAFVVGFVCAVAVGIPAARLLLRMVRRHEAARYHKAAESWPPEPGYSPPTVHILTGRTSRALPHPRNDRIPVTISGQDLIQRKED